MIHMSSAQTKSTSKKFISKQISQVQLECCANESASFGPEFTYFLLNMSYIKVTKATRKKLNSFLTSTPLTKRKKRTGKPLLIINLFSYDKNIVCSHCFSGLEFTVKKSRCVKNS